MFIDRCLVCLSTPFKNYFIIHLSCFIIMSNYVFFFFLTLGTCFSMFVYICARFRFVLIGGNLTAKSTLSYIATGELDVVNSHSRDVVASSPSFTCPTARAPRRAWSQANDFALCKACKVIRNLES